MCDNDWDDMDVNKRSDDKVRFESPLIQSIYDRIDYLRDETKAVLKDLDSNEFKQNIDEFDIEEFGEDTIDKFSDILDDLSKARRQFIKSEDLPDVVGEYSRDAKIALNRDYDYIRRAKRKLDKNSAGLVDNYKSNIRVIELCDKAIKLDYLNEEAYYLKGLALINIEEYDEAITQLIKSLALDDSLDIRLEVANTYRLNRQFNYSIEAYDSVLKLDNNSFEAFKGKAYTYYDWEKYGQADIFFKKANSIENLDDDSYAVWQDCIKK